VLAVSGPRLISVILPVLNNADTIGEQLAALSRQTYEGPWEAIVADNGSTDATAGIVARWADRVPGLRVVDCSDRRQVAHARNVGSRAAAGDFFLYCDGDDVVADDWLAAMARAAETCVAVGGPLEEHVLNSELLRSWSAPRTPDGIPLIFGQVPYGPGANCGVRRDVFEALGGFDETFEGAGEEIDFFWRVQLAGHTVCWVPDAVVHYRLRPGYRALRRQWFKYGAAQPELYVRYRQHGIAPSSVRAVLQTLAFELAYAPTTVLSRRRRGAWLMRVSYLAGQIDGSVRQRVFRVGPDVPPRGVEPGAA
jgi:glycosyltransferase involved in cell wall biosynthesis